MCLLIFTSWQIIIFRFDTFLYISYKPIMTAAILFITRSAFLITYEPGLLEVRFFCTGYLKPLFLSIQSNTVKCHVLIPLKLIKQFWLTAENSRCKGPEWCGSEGGLLKGLSDVALYNINNTPFIMTCNLIVTCGIWSLLPDFQRAYWSINFVDFSGLQWQRASVNWKGGDGITMTVSDEKVLRECRRRK